jgi:hypothetical protein
MVGSRAGHWPARDDVLLPQCATNQTPPGVFRAGQTSAERCAGGVQRLYAPLWPTCADRSRRLPGVLGPGSYAKRSGDLARLPTLVRRTRQPQSCSTTDELDVSQGWTYFDPRHAGVGLFEMPDPVPDHGVLPAGSTSPVGPGNRLMADHCMSRTILRNLVGNSLVCHRRPRAPEPPRPDDARMVAELHRYGPRHECRHGGIAHEQPCPQTAAVPQTTSLGLGLYMPGVCAPARRTWLSEPSQCRHQQRTTCPARNIT